jgi:hypothetical protein
VRTIAYERFTPGVTLDTIQPHLPDEVANARRLWKAGIHLEWFFDSADGAGADREPV